MGNKNSFYLGYFNIMLFDYKMDTFSFYQAMFDFLVMPKTLGYKSIDLSWMDCAINKEGELGEDYYLFYTQEHAQRLRDENKYFIHFIYGLCRSYPDNFLNLMDEDQIYQFLWYLLCLRLTNVNMFYCFVAKERDKTFSHPRGIKEIKDLVFRGQAMINEIIFRLLIVLRFPPIIYKLYQLNLKWEKKWKEMLQEMFPNVFLESVINSLLLVSPYVFLFFLSLNMNYYLVGKLLSYVIGFRFFIYFLKFIIICIQARMLLDRETRFHYVLGYIGNLFLSLSLIGIIFGIFNNYFPAFAFMTLWVMCLLKFLLAFILAYTNREINMKLLPFLKRTNKEHYYYNFLIFAYSFISFFVGYYIFSSFFPLPSILRKYLKFIKFLTF